MNLSPVRSDVRLLHGLWRRARWHLHWAIRPTEPVVLQSWWDGMTLVLPRSGSAAPAFYRTFPSHAIARWMAETLQPGMTVIDIGAHVGVYSMLAARLVGPAGVVHAIEPQERCIEFIERNGTVNALTNLRTHRLALAEADGVAEMVVDERSMGGRLVAGPRSDDTVPVPTQTLQTFAASEALFYVNLLKLDAAGNELAVLRGAGSLLSGAIETIICKLYNRDVVAERFRVSEAPLETVALLRRAGYDLTLAGGETADEAALDDAFARDGYTIPLLARRQNLRL
jgi:FkbM family methyltransferase